MGLEETRAGPQKRPTSRHRGTNGPSHLRTQWSRVSMEDSVQPGPSTASSGEGRAPGKESGNRGRQPGTDLLRDADRAQIVALFVRHPPVHVAARVGVPYPAYRLRRRGSGGHITLQHMGIGRVQPQERTPGGAAVGAPWHVRVLRETRGQWGPPGTEVPRDGHSISFCARGAARLHPRPRACT